MFVEVNFLILCLILGNGNEESATDRHMAVSSPNFISLILAAPFGELGTKSTLFLSRFQSGLTLFRPAALLTPWATIIGRAKYLPPVEARS